MGVFTKRKFKKLFKNPKLFFADSRIFSYKKLFSDTIEVIDLEKKKFIEVPNKLDTKRIFEVQKNIKNNDLNMAKKLLDDLWYEFPWNILIVQEYSVLYQKQHKYDDAIRLLDLSIGRLENWLSFYNRGITKQAKGLVGEAVISDFTVARRLSKNGEIRPLKKLVKATWASTGVSPTLINLCSDLEKYPEKLNAADYLQISSIYNEGGRYLLAYKAYKNALMKDKSIIERIQYLPLMAMVSGFENNTSQIFGSVQSYMRFVTTSEGMFVSLVKNAKRRVSIVGNSPAELGKKRGAKIDKNKLVIRFNSYDTDFPLSEDYGSKTNIWVKAGNYVELPRRNLMQFDCIVVSGYNPLYRNTMGTDLVLDACNVNTPINFIPNSVYEELIEKIGVMPSAGLAIIFWIYKISGVVPKRNIYGFSFGKQKENKNEHYFKNNKRSDYYSHNWRLEAQVLNEITC